MTQPVDDTKSSVERPATPRAGGSRLAVLLNAAELLQPALRGVFQSLYVEGRSTEETARNLGVAVGDVERDRKALLNCLKHAVAA